MILVDHIDTAFSEDVFKKTGMRVSAPGADAPCDRRGIPGDEGDVLASAQDVSGAIVLDMIGYRKHGDPVFQVSAGEPPGSIDMARIAMGVAARTAPELKGELRARFDERSIYNTLDAGFPVVLINEHLNKLENLNRRAYHDSTDTPSRLDWGYAEALAKIAIETAAQAASSHAPRLPPGFCRCSPQTDYSCGAASMLSVLKYWRAFDDC